MNKLEKFSFGIGDRFGHQAEAQLKAIIDFSQKSGYEITPVWNKSHREHTIIGSTPVQTQTKAKEAVEALGWKHPWFVDADHVNLDTVGTFVDHADFFTIDVASYIGRRGEKSEETAFLHSVTELIDSPLHIPGLSKPLEVTKGEADKIIAQYLFAAFMAGETYKKIAQTKKPGSFVTEVSMDEVPAPQKPVELFFILAMLGYYKVPLQTIAPRFTGRFNKGVDYVGDPEKFAEEFEADLLVAAQAAELFDLPRELKLSIHSGSDKFSIYPHIKAITKKYNKGFHLKTAGTTWLEEVTGLALAGGEALQFVKNFYGQALQQSEALCVPYADVIDIDTNQLPEPAEVESWSPEQFAAALQHEPGEPHYNPNLRQLIHVGYKLAAQNIETYNRLLTENESIVHKCVYDNIYRRHLVRLY